MWQTVDGREKRSQLKQIEYFKYYFCLLNSQMSTLLRETLRCYDDFTMTSHHELGMVDVMSYKHFECFDVFMSEIHPCTSNWFPF